ncbi:MAG: hypothetical protein EHM49_05965, partial [Deltaproteobacteria bacterium]
MPTPPWDQKSEQALLAAFLLGANIYKQLDLSVDDFYDSNHQQVYQIIGEICEEGMEVDYVSINAKIKAKGLMDKIDISYLTS